MIIRFKLFELTSIEISQVELGDRLRVIDPNKNTNKGIGDYTDCVVVGYPHEIIMYAKNDPTQEIKVWMVDVVDLTTKEEAVAFLHPEKKVWVIKEWKNPFMLQRNSFHYENNHPERYWLHYVEQNCVGQKYGNDLERLKNFALSNPEMKTWEIYLNAPGFHSTTQDEYLVCWYDEGGRDYWSNMAAKFPELKKKQVAPPPRVIAKRFDM